MINSPLFGGLIQEMMVISFSSLEVMKYVVLGEMVML